MYYSPSTHGFYDSSIHASAIPADAVAITAAEHAALLQAQAQGMVIQTGEDGRPEAVERVLTLAEQTAARIAEIKAALAALDASSARPLRAILAAQQAGVSLDQDDVDMLASLEAQAQALRAELTGLEA